MADYPLIDGDGFPVLSAEGAPRIGEENSNCCCSECEPTVVCNEATGCWEFDDGFVLPPGCTILERKWTFSDGTTSTSKNPIKCQVQTFFSAQLDITTSCGVECHTVLFPQGNCIPKYVCPCTKNGRPPSRVTLTISGAPQFGSPTIYYGQGSSQRPFYGNDVVQDPDGRILCGPTVTNPAAQARFGNFPQKAWGFYVADYSAMNGTYEITDLSASFTIPGGGGRLAPFILVGGRLTNALRLKIWAMEYVSGGSPNNFAIPTIYRLTRQSDAFYDLSFSCPVPCDPSLDLTTLEPIDIQSMTTFAVGASPLPGSVSPPDRYPYNRTYGECLGSGQGSASEIPRDISIVIDSGYPTKRDSVCLRNYGITANYSLSLNY